MFCLPTVCSNDTTSENLIEGFSATQLFATMTQRAPDIILEMGVGLVRPWIHSGSTPTNPDGNSHPIRHTLEEKDHREEETSRARAHHLPGASRGEKPHRRRREQRRTERDECEQRQDRAGAEPTSSATEQWRQCNRRRGPSAAPPPRKRAS
ncbi:hypothetical protein U1Q18_026295 [Sarracenia purpurea var. burkii]